jgi:hypothetical protein
MSRLCVYQLDVTYYLATSAGLTRSAGSRPPGYFESFEQHTKRVGR